MTLSPARWHVIADSNFAWEREALEWLRSHLPERDPWHVWTNFEFIDDEGKVSEVDALVLSPAGLFLVEIKSRPGELTGDAHSWTWKTDGRVSTYDNPLILANRKAKRLASLLKRQPAIIKAKIRLPFVEPAIFLSSSSLACRLEGIARSATFQHGRPGAPDDEGIVGALAGGIANRGASRVDAQQARAIARGLNEAGIRPSNKHRQVGDYKLGKLLAEGEGFQDWEARHVAIETVHRRVRIYTVATASNPEARANRVRQARREFEVLEGIDHPGILKVKDYKETELGPALVFDHDPTAVRLDHLLRDLGPKLTVTQRLQLVRDIAETLKYAHAKRLYHRALGPQSILAQKLESGTYQLRLMNWQTASRNVGESASPDTVHRTTGTRHVEDYVEDPGLVYLAPETTQADPAHGPSLDVFSLGCIAYHVFSSQPPGDSVLERNEKLRIGQGLDLASAMDGCGAHQQELIQVATRPEVLARYETIRGFLDELDAVEDELTAPDPEATVDPSVAGARDRLEGGFTVLRRMGRGSSSDALMVREDGSDEALILKVALDAAHNDRLVAEGEVLARLHHHNIVAHRRTLSVAGRTALLLKSAGDKTLAETLKEEREQGRLSLDMLQRFGEELIEAVNHLEAEGVAHRDIKPENIGITSSRTGKLQLVLFDFSLCRTPTDNITAGTHPYLDPFLSLRNPPRWDLYAERFAAAVTLYEMTVGQPPVWGDGQTAPAMLDVEATIESDVFDPVTREGFTTFFARALKRDYSQRYDNAEDMLRAWRAVFTARQTAHPDEGRTEGGLAAIAMTATPLTTMAELGYSLEAQDVLERMGVHSARGLLAVDRIRFRYLRGVGDKIRKEIRLTAKELARLRPDLMQGRGTAHDSDDDTPGAVSINELAAQLLPRRPAGDERPEEAALAHYLGLDDAVKPGAWPTLGAAAQAGEVDRAALTTALIKARERWLRNTAFTELRQQLDALVRSQGQVMSALEASLALLSLRGCAEQDDAERLRQAGAVLRAAVEAESHLDEPRFEAFDHAPVSLIASAAEWADYARQLGTAADACAMADPLLPPARVLSMLEGVEPAATAATGAGAAAPLAASRLLRLAASASRTAALSSRQEIYPRGMPALQALKQSINALVGALLSPAALQTRVRGRYPEAAPLPGRPELDRLLEEAGAPLSWDPTAADGLGAYRSATLGSTATAGTATQFSRQGTVQGASGPDAGLLDAAAAEERLQRSLRQGGLLVITVDPRLAHHAEPALLRRFGGPHEAGPALRRVNLDALLLRELKAQAQVARVDWNVVLRADAAERSSRDWTNLMRLVQRTLPALRAALLQSAAPLLLVSAGLLARYDLMPLISELEAAAGRPGHTPGAWLLLPTARQGLPLIDGEAVPLVNNIDNTQTLALPKAWVEIQHRASSAA
ncbi:MAG: BREX system serine/threonine kinase PglW [Burkholderiaceae bacterium]|nr:BREX system serine/threonine kinase PglW [Burkholderiaceae bacterium]